MASVAVGGRRLVVQTASARDQPFVLFPSMGEYPVYDDRVYDGFDAPDQRVRAYRDAIDATAPGRVVLDIGTGRDALWALHAARAGARHVYAIERQPQVVARARQAVADAGFADRVTVLEGLSTMVSLPERAEVCVSEIVGNIASAEGAAIVLADARRRLCTVDCAWIPFRVRTWAAAIDLFPALGTGNYSIAAESLPYLEQVFASVGHPFDLRLCLAGPVRELLVWPAVAVESMVFDSRRDPPPADATGTTDLTVGHSGRVTGLLLWTRVAVTSSAAEIDALASDTRSWAPVYAPLSLDGVDVTRGDRLRVTFRRTTSDDGVHPDYEARAAGLTWVSHHHGRGFRRTALYRHLFPVSDAAAPSTARYGSR